MIIPTTYGQLRRNSRIVLPSGRPVHVISIAFGSYGLDLGVVLRDDLGRTRTISVLPSEPTTLVLDEAAGAVASLAQRFPDVEFLRSI